MLQRIYDWVIGVWSNKDRLIWDSHIAEIGMADKKIFEYNQYKLKANNKSCTLFASFWAISDLFNYRFTDKDISELNKLSYEAWRMKNKWRRLYKAVDIVREYRNTNNPDKKVMSFSLEANSERHQEALGKWHTTPTVFHWNSKYNRDVDDNGAVNWTKFWSSTYWHAIDLRNVDYTRVKDSQDGYKYNKYLLANYQGLIDSGVYSNVAYLFLPERTIAESPQAMKIKQASIRTIWVNSLMHKIIEKNLEASKLNIETMNNLHEANESLRSLDIILK